ncbi:hypothetical protein [Sinomonas mesophila]|uniref:hypothetical protein n=1 Tax=Sinomonas mesophila TaxID=1531955 RepID=UPI000985FB0B|nr:hypothetical protein [Sinomonas mesophila]
MGLGAFGRRLLAGALGGLAGGLVFGVLMAMVGILPMVAAMVGSSSLWVGFGVHLVISVLIGWGLTVPFARLLSGYGRAVLVGLAYGVVWWVLGPLVIMPAILGMPLFMVDGTNLMSLLGHLAYGAILALTATRVLKSHA